MRAQKFDEFLKKITYNGTVDQLTKQNKGLRNQQASFSYHPRNTMSQTVTDSLKKATANHMSLNFEQLQQQIQLKQTGNFELEMSRPNTFKDFTQVHQMNFQRIVEANSPIIGSRR